MKKFVCTVCGYVHEGENPPEECPVCHQPSSKFREESVSIEKKQRENKSLQTAEQKKEDVSDETDSEEEDMDTPAESSQKDFDRDEKTAKTKKRRKFKKKNPSNHNKDGNGQTNTSAQE